MFVKQLEKEKKEKPVTHIYSKLVLNILDHKDSLPKKEIPPDIAQVLRYVSQCTILDTLIPFCFFLQLFTQRRILTCCLHRLAWLSPSGSRPRQPNHERLSSGIGLFTNLIWQTTTLDAV